MTRFIIGLLLGLLLGIGGTAAFLITAGGGDYLVVQSPRVRELEAALKNVDQDRQWLRSRLDEANDSLAKLESRFSGLAARFESMAMSQAGMATPPAPEPQAPPSDTAANAAGGGAAEADRAAAVPDEGGADPSHPPVERVEP